ncbi:unnamed protein product [Protopolystoma xenopodis]|uniref:Lipase maturation factor 2 n=1 Tax=Protopolystoma xenopodis TaxID=117903 RepID=A0A3S5BMY9_9PLAT|nr:unnamed protein product [Protopolystoma xenopodis]
MGACILLASFVPLSTLHPDTQTQLPAPISNLYAASRPASLVNGYGLFRRMTGVGGRPELVIEGSQTETGPWREYEFHHKPGRVDKTLPFIDHRYEDQDNVAVGCSFIWLYTVVGSTLLSQLGRSVMETLCNAPSPVSSAIIFVISSIGPLAGYV